jgi:hypothetical protein
MPGRVCRLRSANGNSKKAQRSGVSGHSPDHHLPQRTTWGVRHDEHKRQLGSTRSAPLAGTVKIVVFVTHDTAAASSCDARHSGGGQSKLV